MKKLHVFLEKRSYDIVIGQGLLSQSSEYIKKLCHAEKLMIVTDTTVEKLYGDVLSKSLEAAGFLVKIVSFPPGEGSKTMDTIQKLYEEAFAFGMTRTDMVVALGGGVVGDVTGFFAATLYRGVPFVQIPTTLLAQVDSSVGGKTGVNTSAGKNLVGSFYQPKLVLIDTDTLKTLSDKIFADGMAEVIKYGAIADKGLFYALEKAEGRSGVESILEDVVYTCCNIKRQIVEEDELDTGKRMLLNFGHTMGHVVEKQYQYKTYTHGEGVAYGMVLIAKLGETLSLTKQGTAQRIVTLLKQFNLPTDIPLQESWKNVILLDKKMQGKNLSCVLIKDLGDSFVYKLPVTTFVEEMEKEI